MDSHLTTETVRKYRGGALTPVELLELDSHLEACALCQKTIRSDADAAELRNELAEKHLTYEQIEAAVDERLSGDAQDAADAHLAECEVCLAEFEDLRALRTALRKPSNAKHRPVGIWAVAASAAVILIAASAVWFATERKIADPARETAAADRIVDGGTEIAVYGAGEVKGLSALPASQQKLMAAALIAGEVPVPVLAEKLRQKPGMLLSSDHRPSQFQVVGPINTVVFNKPVFKWQPITGASDYVVEVFDQGFRPIVKSPPVAGTQWTPESWPDPPPDALFYWQVTATVGRDSLRVPQPPAPQAIFGAPSAESRQAILEARTGHADSHLLLGLLYMQAGAIDEARSEFDALAAANPGSPAVSRLRAAAQNPSPNNTKPAQ